MNWVRGGGGQDGDDSVATLEQYPKGLNRSGRIPSGKAAVLLKKFEPLCPPP